MLLLLVTHLFLLPMCVVINDSISKLYIDCCQSGHLCTISDEHGRNHNMYQCAIFRSLFVKPHTIMRQLSSKESLVACEAQRL